MSRHARRSRLVDCDVHGAGTGAELIVVEGEAAASAVAQVRDPRLQAVLAMQGKPLNALRASDGKVASNPFLGGLTEAIGAGRGAAFDPRTLRYDRIVLLMDPDADGIHAGALLLLFIYRWMPPLLESGHVVRVHAPVGEIRPAGVGPTRYAYSVAQFHALSAELRATQAQTCSAIRYRGLAGLDNEVLARDCVRPATRRGHVLTTADAKTAMEVFASLRNLPAQGSLF